MLYIIYITFFFTLIIKRTGEIYFKSRTEHINKKSINVIIKKKKNKSLNLAEKSQDTPLCFIISLHDQKIISAELRLLRGQYYKYFKIKTLHTNIYSINSNKVSELLDSIFVWLLGDRISITFSKALCLVRGVRWIMSMSLFEKILFELHFIGVFSIFINVTR